MYIYIVGYIVILATVHHLFNRNIRLSSHTQVVEASKTAATPPSELRKLAAEMGQPIRRTHAFVPGAVVSCLVVVEYSHF